MERSARSPRPPSRSCSAWGWRSGCRLVRPRCRCSSRRMFPVATSATVRSSSGIREGCSPTADISGGRGKSHDLRSVPCGSLQTEPGPLGFTPRRRGWGAAAQVPVGGRHWHRLAGEQMTTSFGRRTLLAGGIAAAAPAACAGGALDGNLSGAASMVARTAENPFGVTQGSAVDAVIFNGGYKTDDIDDVAEQARKKLGRTHMITPSAQVARELQPRFVGGIPPGLVDNAGANQIGMLTIVDRWEDLTSLLEANTSQGRKIAGTVCGETLTKAGTYNGTFLALNYAIYLTTTLDFAIKESGVAGDRRPGSQRSQCKEARGVLVRTDCSVREPAVLVLAVNPSPPARRRTRGLSWDVVTLSLVFLILPLGIFVYVAGMALLFMMLLGAMCAYVLARCDMPDSRVSHASMRGNYHLMMGGLMLPVFFALVPMLLQLQNFGWRDTRESLIVTYVAFVLPLTMFFLYAFFRSLQGDIGEAAQIDGANTWVTLFWIYLSMAKPSLATVTIMNFLGLWDQYSAPGGSEGQPGPHRSQPGIGVVHRCGGLRRRLRGSARDIRDHCRPGPAGFTSSSSVSCRAPSRRTRSSSDPVGRTHREACSWS